MASFIDIGEVIRIKVVFREWQNTILDYGPPRDVDDSVEVEIYREGELQVGSEPIYASRTPEDTNLDIINYYYDWEPTESGSFEVVFVGELDGEEYRISEFFEVGAGTFFSASLMEDQELIFSSYIEPMYADPESFLAYYPSAPLIEIAELVYKHSYEIDKIFGVGAELPIIAYQYVEAAVLCSLSRVYDYGAGGGEATSLSLGDLSISKQSYPKNHIDRANAGNWCELAAALREEMLRAKGNMKTVVTGTKYNNPIPSRGLRKGSEPSQIGGDRFSRF